MGLSNISVSYKDRKPLVMKNNLWEHYESRLSCFCILLFCFICCANRYSLPVTKWTSAYYQTGFKLTCQTGTVKNLGLTDKIF